jgi:capsular polysaccharide transport system permease protein
VKNPLGDIQQRLLRAWHWLLGHRLFLYTVAIPTTVSIIYFGLVASDIYISESRYIVRGSQQQSSSTLGLMLKDTGLSRAEDDSYSVQNFILSRDALIALDNQLHLKAAFSASSVDFVRRFASLGRDRSFEAFRDYYQNMVDVQLDSDSSITTLKTRAFSAADARAMNGRLLEFAEDLVNRLNERANRDMIRYAAGEVAEAEAQSRAASRALAQFRNQNGVIDPEQQSAIPLQRIGKLEDQRIATNAQLELLDKLASNSPQIGVLRQQAQQLNQEIAEETQRVAGTGGRSLAGKAAEYERLALTKAIADKMLESAMGTLALARNEALRQQLYLERIVQPGLPDQAMEPHRKRNIAATLLLGLIIWSVLSLTVAAVREHAD